MSNPSWRNWVFDTRIRQRRIPRVDDRVVIIVRRDLIAFEFEAAVSEKTAALAGVIPLKDHEYIASSPGYHPTKRLVAFLGLHA